jgi:acylphosphatase
MPLVRRRVHFSGRVQGVGFRIRCQSVARNFKVTGYVRNLADGRVELVAEGESSELDDFLNAIRLELRPYISEVTTESRSPGSDPFTGFSIRD